MTIESPHSAVGTGNTDTSRTTTSEVTSTFQRRPCYRYVRSRDALPTYTELGDRPLAKIVCPVRLFNPTGPGTWWLASYDHDTGVAWGVADILEREVGSFGMDELVAFRGLGGLPIERDLHYTPATIAAILEGAR